jgi:hypothetical protein
MRYSSLMTTLVLAGALAFGARPVFAQRGGGGGGHMGGGGGGHMGGGGGGRMGGGGGVRMGGGGAPMGGRFGGGRIGGVPGGMGSGRVFAPAAGIPRGSAGVRGPGFNRVGGFNGNRGAFGPRFNGNARWWGGRSWNVAPLHFFHPYYAFHPRFSLGFGLWAGYPFAWAYPYYYSSYYSGYPYYPDYPYPYPYAPAGPGYSVAPPVDDVTPDTTTGTVGVQPDQSNLGGMSFNVTPSDAQVFIDGNYVGTVGQFTPSTQPLGVPAGRHHVEVRNPGYKTMSFDVDIVGGQVIPYQGQMEH